jgi:FdhD protein
MLRTLPRRMSAAQRIFRRTDEPCAAAVFNSYGRMMLVREDICRHNAIDKILGYGLFNDLLPFDQHVLVTAGRASYEVVQKALAGGFPIVVACGEPSSLAERFAREAGQTLVIHGPGERVRVHTHPQRIQQTTSTQTHRDGP